MSKRVASREHAPFPRFSCQVIRVGRGKRAGGRSERGGATGSGHAPSQYILTARSHTPRPPGLSPLNANTRAHPLASVSLQACFSSTAYQLYQRHLRQSKHEQQPSRRKSSGRHHHLAGLVKVLAFASNNRPTTPPPKLTSRLDDKAHTFARFCLAYIIPAQVFVTWMSALVPHH